MRGHAAPPHPGIYQVPPHPPGLKNKLGDPHFLLSNCNQHDKTLLFAKLKIFVKGVQSHLKFVKI